MLPDTLTLNSALKSGQYVEWKGRIYSGHYPGKLYIYENRADGQVYTALYLQIQGARNRVSLELYLKCAYSALLKF